MQASCKMQGTLLFSHLVFLMREDLGLKGLLATALHEDHRLIRLPHAQIWNSCNIYPSHPQPYASLTAPFRSTVNVTSKRD